MNRRTCFHLAVLGLLGGLFITGAAPGQSLDERLDEEAYLRGLVDLRLPDVLEHYIATTPARDETSRALRELAMRQMQLAQISAEPSPLTTMTPCWSWASARPSPRLGPCPIADGM